jgi:replicative DNA helicase
MAREIDYGQEKSDELTRQAEKLREYEALREYDREDKAITSHEVWKQLEVLRSKPVAKFMTKFPTLDSYLDGFREGDVVVVSGITKNGKTTLCQNITNSLAESGVNCMWFSYEVMPLEFLTKFKPELPFFTMPAKLKNNALAWIDQRIAEHIAKFNTKVVFIDHLHFLLDMSQLGRGGNTSLIIGGIMRELKNIAIDREVCIVLVAHTTKIKFDEEPDLSSIRDSSFIGQEADTVLMIWRVNENGIPSNEARLAVLANRRNGRTGKIKLIMNEGIFTELSMDYED